MRANRKASNRIVKTKTKAREWKGLKMSMKQKNKLCTRSKKNKIISINSSSNIINIKRRLKPNHSNPNRHHRSPTKILLLLLPHRLRSRPVRLLLLFPPPVPLPPYSRWRKPPHVDLEINRQRRFRLLRPRRFLPRLLLLSVQIHFPFMCNIHRIQSQPPA